VRKIRDGKKRLPGDTGGNGKEREAGGRAVKVFCNPGIEKQPPRRS